MSESKRNAGGGSSAARGVLLALLTAAALAGFLFLLVGLGMLRIVREQAAANVDSAGAVTQPSRRLDDSGSDESATEPSIPTPVGPATHGSDAPTPADAPAVVQPRVAAVAPAALRQASASLLRVDDDSRGNWVGRYGKQGYFVAMAGATPHFPPGVEATLYQSQFYTWSSPTTDPRGLSVPATPSRLSAGQWFAWDHFSLDLDLRKGPEPVYQVALYLLDWDSDARAQRLEVVDAETGVTLLSRTDEYFRHGRYLILRLSGHVTLRFTRTGGANCTLSGVFLDDQRAPNH